MATVTINYSALLTVAVKHLYYSNQVCRAYQTTPILDFTIVPTDECVDYMKSKSLIFKSTDATGGFVVLGRTVGKNMAGNDLLRSRVASQDKLTFFMVLNNADVLNFDALPTQPNPGNIYYFSNKITDNAAARNNLHISKSKTGVDGANDQVKKSGSIYTFSYAGVLTPADVKVKHILTGATIGPASIIVQNTKSVVTFDLSVFPSGRCQLLVNNVINDSFYFLGTMANQQVFGVIELSLAPGLNSNYRIVEADQSLVPLRPNYTILFQNRATIWRYNFLLQPNSPIYLEMAKLTTAQKAAYISQLNISCNDTSIKFKLASNTDQSFVFVSLASIALQEKYILSTSPTGDPLIFTLNKLTTKEVRPSLPYPSTGSIDATSLPTIYSDVFITL